MIGTTILHYKVGDKLGSGGMGEVYRGEDTRLGRPVALKFLSKVNRADPEKRRRLFQEARAASALRSPHVAVTHDVVEEGGELFIVMELVEGEPLERKLEHGVLPVLEVVDIGLQTAEALEEAHSRGIIHRDIKPANIMITPRGLVKVLDFGIAKNTGLHAGGVTDAGGRTSTVADLTSPGVVLGTVSYMSPEQALGRPVDHRSDIFSLGIVLYQCLCGALPFNGRTLMEVIDSILHREPTPVALLRSDVPAQLSLLIQQAMEKSLEYRLHSASDLVASLRKLSRALDPQDRLLDDDIVDGDTRFASQSPRTGSHSRLLENSVAVLTFANILKEAADDWIGTGIAETVTADLQNVRGLNVIARARVYEVLRSLGTGALSDPSESLTMEAGRRLGATWVVRGAYQRVGQIVRITANFGEVRTGRLLKTVKVDGKIEEIFQLQDKIVYGLMQGIDLKLEDTEIARIESQETKSVEAYESCSRGMLSLRTGDRDALDRAISLFEKAIGLDPQYASAWAGLASANCLKGMFLGLRDYLERAVAHARRAIAIRPGLASAHAWLGSALNGLERQEEAIAAISEALRIEPANPQAHSLLARAYWVGLGRIDEGILELEKSIELNPEFGYCYLQLAFLHALKRDLPRAEAAARKAVELQEKAISGAEGLRIVGAYSRLGYVYYLKEDYDAAIREYERELGFLSASDHALRERTLIELHEKLGAAWRRKGDHDESERWLRRAVKAYETRQAQGSDEPFTQYYAACAYALLGDTAKALAALTASIARLGPLNRPRAAADPEFEALRGQPEFEKLVRPS